MKLSSTTFPLISELKKLPKRTKAPPIAEGKAIRSTSHKKEISLSFLLKRYNPMTAANAAPWLANPAKPVNA